jgi:peptide/nickel transport system permease protein
MIYVAASAIVRYSTDTYVRRRQLISRTIPPSGGIRHGGHRNVSWISYALKRVAISVGILLGASVVIFSIIRLVPGDPALIVLGQFAEEGAADAMRQRLGLDRPVWEQYFVWIHGVVTGNWGHSVINNQPVRDMIAIRYPRSLQLALLGLLMSVFIAFPLGIVGSINRNKLPDYGALFFSQFGVSIPGFWLGILFILVFARYLNVLPASGYYPLTQDPVRNLQHAFLPALTLGIINAAIITRYLRSEMLEELSKDYTRTARAFGHPESRVTRKYVLKNALMPTITIIGIQFGYMIGGIVIIEQVFSYPGLGQLLLDGLLNRDYPVIQLSLLVLAATFIVANLLVDLVYGLLDPRIKY